MEHFRQAYEGHPPWDVGHAQRALVEIAPRVKGSVLDIGCGTGDNAIFFAQRGHVVYGIDFIEEATELAKTKADEQGVRVCFLTLDALSLDDLPIAFDTVIDCGLFHVFSDEDRTRYVQSLAKILGPGGHLWLLCFSDAEPLGSGPRRIAPSDLEGAFSDGWDILEIEPTRFETSPHVLHGTFSEGGPHALRTLIERNP